jgi:hypothetical protein
MVSPGPTIIESVAVPTAGLFQGGGLYDLIDLPTLKDDLDIKDGSADKFLQRAITRVSTDIRRHCNRTFQLQGYLEQFWAFRDPYPWQLPSGFAPLQLSQWPIGGTPSLSGTAPPLPSTIAAVGGGSLARTNYFVRTTFVTATGETGTSTEQNLVVPAGSLLQVDNPQPDPAALAIGWNVYVSTSAGTEILQNASPISLNASWTEPAAGLLTAGQAPTFPIFISVTVNVPNADNNNLPTNLIEGVDYIADRGKAQLTRYFTDGMPRRWEALPIAVQYWAGYTKETLPPELQDACEQLIKRRYYGRLRDPSIRSENVVGALETQYWFASGPGSDGQFPPDIAAMIDQHRMPVIG